MKNVDIKNIKELRDKTGAGFSDCKKALHNCNLDIKKSIEWLRKQGLSRMVSSKETIQGAVASYIHMGGKIGVLTEVNTETDFAARSEAFQKFVKHLTLHITAMNPLFLSKEDISELQFQQQKELFKRQTLKEGKSEKVLEKILKGRLDKWSKEVCLLDQPFFHPENQNDEKTVREALAELVNQVREKVIIRRFVRYELGQINKGNGFKKGN